MAAPPLGPELEAVARSHRAARRQLRVLLAVNRGLTFTAIVILLAGTWQNPGELSGVTLTANAFYSQLGTPGMVMLSIVALESQ